MSAQLQLGLQGGADRAVSWRRVPGITRAHHEMLVGGAPTGVWVRCCGHPTALRPYYLAGPGGMLVERKFALLAEAKAAIVALVEAAGGFEVWRIGDSLFSR